MFKIHSVYGTVGVMLSLVALYLVLEHGAQFSTAITSLANAGGNIIAKLQGR